MADLSSEQDELYYFAKNFSKLKFSNQAYIDSTQKQKVQNEKEIEKLKKDYEKLRNDVNVLKKTCLYVPGRVKSAASSENNFYRLKLDEARNNKKKSQEAFNQLNKKLEELKSEEMQEKQIIEIKNLDNIDYTSKLKEEKQNIEIQLNGVSKAILNIAEDMQKENESNEEYKDKEEQIIQLLKQREILVQDISIKKNLSNRYIIELYVETSRIKDLDKIIENILTKVLNEKIIINSEEELKFEKMTKYTCMADDKFIITIGQSGAIKDNKDISGDSILKIRLKDGKYLIAISDGMGSGPQARKSSQIVVKMLQRLLNSGFEKNTSIDLINSSLLNVSEDVFATLDIAIADLYKGNIEFIKSGACPTYIKNNKKVQIIKSLALPAGILKDITGEVFDKDIENEDIMIMCTDGIIDSNIEYKNKELWVKYLLEDIENDNPQKIADIILNESIDNNFGKIKDDMSVIVCKFIHK